MKQLKHCIYPGWPAPSTVRAISTTRSGGVSRPPYDSFNLAAHVGDDPAAVASNRSHLASMLDLPSAPHWLTQVHGNRVIDIDQDATENPQVDAVFTSQSGQVCAIMTADCIPVLFCDRQGSRVAAAHAGWRGLAGGVLEATLEAMAMDPADLLVWLGPAIGPAAFEVGDEVRQVFLEQAADDASAFTPSINADNKGHWMADLYALSRQRLARSGVSSVYGGEYCTYTDAGRFYSYRRDGVTGRMASLIWLTNG